MQLLEDKSEDFGDTTERIRQLREKVQALLEENLSKKSNHAENLKQKHDLLQETASLKKQLEEKDAFSTKKSVENEKELIEENILLKKQLEEKEKTIKDLNYKLEMFKLGKTLREGTGENRKSEELKQMITEYIKEIDRSITSLNIE